MTIVTITDQSPNNVEINTNTSIVTISNTQGPQGASGTINTTTLTGDVNGSGVGTVPTTLASVNSNVGSFTNASITVDAKGRILAASNGAGSGGTVTSVSGSGGTTGLTLTGGPITNSGTLTLGGTLGIANGGHGQTTALNGFDALKQAASTSYAGVTQLASSANVGTGTDNLKSITPSALKTSLGFSKFMDSGAIAFSNNSTSNITNTMGVIPLFMTFQVECITTDTVLGATAGDVFEYYTYAYDDAGVGSYGISVRKSSSTISLTSSAAVKMVSTSTASPNARSSTSIDWSKWRLRFYAFA